jgi:hypothetical protein
MTYAVVGYKNRVEEQGLALQVVGPFYHTERANRAKSILEIAKSDMRFEVIALADGVKEVSVAKTKIRQDKRAQRNV